MLDGQGNLASFAAPSAAYPLRYAGVSAETLAVTFDAPQRPGVSRVAFYPDRAATPTGQDQLFVQAPSP